MAQTEFCTPWSEDNGGLAAMQIFAYGEDALTLWALQNKLTLILQTLGDDSDPAQCQIFFRPSFGRRGGEQSAQFGEFDFIVLATSAIYLGESKWPYSSEQVVDGILKLRDEQMVRHDLFKFYIEEWAFGNHDSWHDWTVTAKDKLGALGIKKPLAPELSRLAANLQVILRLIRERYAAVPPVHNVLLFLHSGAVSTHIPVGAGTDFEVVPIDYSEGVFENFIRLT
jgi:hypothetical protein